jgi:hypothetical protein
MVRVPSSTRVRPTYFMAGTCAGANMKPMPAADAGADRLGPDIDHDAERDEHPQSRSATTARGCRFHQQSTGAATMKAAQVEMLKEPGVAAGADHVDGVRGPRRRASYRASP